MDAKKTVIAEKLVNAQFDLFAFIMILMRGAGEASDVLQETNLVILRHEETYDASRPFMPWARGIARKCVLKFYSAKSHEKLVVFDTELIDSLAEKVPCAKDDQPLEDIARLRTCMGRLLPRQHNVIAARYMRGESVGTIANRENCSVGTISVFLHRVRQTIADCMEREKKKAGAIA